MKTEPTDLDTPAPAGVTHCRTVGEAAELQGWTPELYAIGLAEKLCHSGSNLQIQLERLQALASAGAEADKASAEELARHVLLLDALQKRYIHAIAEAFDSRAPAWSERVERLAGVVLRLQRASVNTLGALKVLRSGAP